MSQNNRTILVIEDDTPIRENLQELLSEDYEVIVCSGGRVGLEAAFKQKPDLVICDVTMAGVTGYNVLTEIRSNPTTANIPFIFLTAKVSKEDIRVGMALGANDYLTKPYTQKELLEAIAARLEKFESQPIS